VIPHVHVLYEHGPDGLPYGSSYLRLLRPLSYPGVETRFQVTFTPVYIGSADIVIVDRLWHNQATLAQVEQLIKDVRNTYARLIYTLDDDLFNLPQDKTGNLPTDYREIVQLLLDEADAILVTTPILAQRLQERDRKTIVITNALDERLTGPPPCLPLRWDLPFLVIGYMGTPTHDEDLQMILPALAAITEKSSTPLVLELIGVTQSRQTRAMLQDLPLTLRWKEPPNPVYPSFMTWFTSTRHWDIALAPLVDTPFNRAKSDVKFLDYSALGAAGIYSREPVYGRSVEHGVTGWLADATTESWTEALVMLATQPDLRRELAANAHRHLHDERTLARRHPDWIAALEMIWYG
jgi:processive 1,2-diacylglycerol beta-glucosyltransferase